MRNLSKIDPSTVKKIKFSSPLVTDDSLKTFGILKIENCPSLKDAFEFITSSHFHTFFHRAKCAFVIIAELQSLTEIRQFSDEELEKLQKCFKDKKILVISIESSESSEIYYKQLHEIDLKSVKNSQQDETFNFASLLHRLNSQNFGKFNGKLLETFVDTQSCYDGKRLIDFAVESNKILSIRFLQLFNFDLKVRNENGDRPLEIAASLESMDAFIALLKFKFEFWNDELCKCDYNLLHLRNKNGKTLLMIAAENGNSGVINLLVKFGVDKNVEVLGETAACLAWRHNKFDAFLILLKFDARYPKNFKNQLEERWENVPKELKKFVSTIETFHLNISRNEFQESEKILQHFPNILHFYNTNNQSAALTALKNSENNSLHLEDLIKRGIFVGFDEKFEGILSQSEDKKTKLSEKELITLMSKSYIGFSTSYDEKKKKILNIFRAFQTLYEIEQIRPILSNFVLRPVKIIFDFNRSSVQHLDPGLEGDELTTASSYHSKGYIYIGAKYLFDARKECDVLATLSHKILHYCLQIIYENNSNPYFALDEERKTEFEEISVFCEHQKTCEKIIANVFEHEKNQQDAELVARIPHIFALFHHNEEKRKNFHENFKKLCGFYDRRIIHDLKTSLSDLRLKNEVLKINSKMEVVKNLRNFPLKLKPESLKVNVNLKDKSLIFVSNCPTLTTFAIFQRHRIESYYNGSSASIQSGKSEQFWHQQKFFIYTTHDKLEINEIVNEIKGILKVMETFECKLSLNLIINCDGASIKVVKNIAKKFQPFKLIFVIDVNGNTINREVLCKNFELREVKHLWNDLNPNSQTILMDYKVEFQGKNMKLANFLEESSPLWKELPLNSLVNHKTLQIDKPIVNDTKYYVRRKFIDSTARCNRWDQERNEYVDEYDKPIKTFDEITGTEATRVLLLADEPKAGKTSTFKSIATRLKDKFITKWIVFIDHHHHADVYRTCKSIEWNQHKLAQFISQDILQLCEFEQKIFEKFFIDGRVIVLLEMNVFYQEILEFAVRIHEQSQNQLWISSWPQHASKLETALTTKAFKLVSFDGENRKEFFTNFLNSKLIFDGAEIEVRLRELEEFLQIHHKEDNFPVDIPLMLRMIAELYENSFEDATAAEFSSNNLFLIYNFFVLKTLGPLTSNSRLNIMQLHQKYALKEVFFRKKKNECEKIVKSLQIMMPRPPNTHKNIFTCGLMYKLEHAKLKFIHKTFADFFVAQYCIDNVLNANLSAGSEAEARCKLFLNIVRDSDRCYKTIHRFLDNYIEMNESDLEERFDESCYNFLSTFKSQQSFQSLLWRLARHRCFYLIKFLTEIYSEDEKTLKEMWGVINTDGYSFLFKTIDKEDGTIDFTFTERIWNLAREVFHDRSDLIAILKTTLIRSSSSVFKNVFPQFWKFTAEFLTTEEKKEIFIKDAHQLFSRNKTKKFFIEVCEIAEEVLDRNEMKMFLTNPDSDGKTFLYDFSKLADDEALIEYLEKIKIYLTPDEQKSLLTKRIRKMFEEDRKTPSKSFRALWSFLESQLDKEELKTLLTTTKTSDFTLLHETILEGDEKTFNFMLEIHEKILEKEEIKKLMLKKFQGNKTLLFKSIGISIESILMVWDYLQDLLDDDEEALKNFIAHRDDFGDTAFSCGWYDTFPKELFAPFIAENFTKIEADALFEKLRGENNSTTEIPSENELSIETVIEPKMKKNLLNCFCWWRRSASEGGLRSS